MDGGNTTRKMFILMLVIILRAWECSWGAAIKERQAVRLISYTVGAEHLHICVLS